MSIIPKILSRVKVLLVTFSDIENHNMRLVGCRNTKDGVTVESSEVINLNDIKNDLTKFPVIVLVSGYGVITKQTDSAEEIVAKVTSEDSGFLWSESGKDISFIRKEQLLSLDNTLAELKVKIVSIQYIAIHNKESEEQFKELAKNYTAQYYARETKIRTLLKPSISSSILGQLIVSKLMLPMLGIIFLSLIINTIISPKVLSKHENANVELEAIQRTRGQVDDATRRQQEFIREYNKQLPHLISWVCDRAALVLPDEITLTSLAVQPPLRSIENGKKTMFADNTVKISGSASKSSDVSIFITNLKKIGLTTHIQLSSMEQDRESGLFNFTIIFEL